MPANNLVPVVDAIKQQLSPCSPGKARKLMKAGRAKPFHQNDAFGIRLIDKTVPADQIGGSRRPGAVTETAETAD